MQLPTYWSSDKAKYIFRLMNRPISPEDDIVTAFRDGTVTLRSNRRTEGFTNSLKEIGYQGVRKGDLVIHAMDGFAGAIGVSDSDGKCTPVYSVCQPVIPASNQFYAYLLRWLALNGFIESLARGIRERSTEFRYKEFKELELPIPPLPEQQAIADFLDHETARIDALIAKYQRMLKLLDEKRSSLINKVVTKGLDPSVPMKDSGIASIGFIPETWQLSKLKEVASIRFSNVDKKSYAGEKEVILCNYIDVYKNEIITPFLDFMVSTASQNEIDKFGLKSGDVLVTKDSESWNDIAIPAYLPESITDLVCGYHLAIIRPNQSRINGAFLHRMLQSRAINYHCEVETTGVTRYGIDYYAIANLPVLVPPVSKQIEIANYIGTITEDIHKASDSTMKLIELLKEYRTSLISSVVTGKINVG